MTAAQAQRGRRMVPPALVFGGVTVASIALHLRDPHHHLSWGECPSYALFGVYCPGCGGLRAVNDLTNLQLGAAASSNLLFICSLPFIAYFFARWVHGRWSGERWQLPAYAANAGVGIAAVVTVAFTILRNTQYGAWLAP